jgi:nitrogen regulatory protein PII
VEEILQGNLLSPGAAKTLKQSEAIEPMTAPAVSRRLKIRGRAGGQSMKEIKAFIRRDKLNETVEALDRAGAPGITVTEVHPVGYGYQPNYFERHYTDLLHSYNYLAIVKLEVVCADRDLEKLVQVIEKTSHTGREGDGVIFITEVVQAIRIRDARRGEFFLVSPASSKKSP